VVLVSEALEPVADEHFQTVEGDDGEVGQTAFGGCPYALDGVEEPYANRTAAASACPRMTA
jgi:hypothetical protein